MSPENVPLLIEHLDADPSAKVRQWSALILGRIGDPRQLSLVLNQIPGVVENGLFVDICDTVIVGFGDGRIELRDINTGETENERLDFVENENMFADLGDWKRD